MSESEPKPNMPDKCPKCGAPLPSGALEGLCPACLLAQGPETARPADAVPFQPPSVEAMARLFPEMEILEFIGKGGMGAVYKARQKTLDRLVALKILPPQAASGPGFAERFNREARALARLNHPNIVAVHEVGQSGESPYFIMEFVDGLTLRQLERAGRLSPREALLIVPQICEALQYAHDQGIVHRDIKPENILIDKKGRVKIADFGIAKIIGGEAEGAAMSATGHALGTPHYMAPEQVEQPQTVDHRADIFSLGVVFYEMLTGQLPLGKFAPPSRKVEIDARLDEVVLRALEREPELRYQQAGDVKTQIDTISATPAQGRKAASTPRRLSLNRAVSIVIAFSCAGFLLAAGIAGFSPRNHSAEARAYFRVSPDANIRQSQAALATSDPVLSRAAAVFPEWIKQKWSAAAGVPRLTDEAVAGRLRSAVTAVPMDGANIVAIRASAGTFQEAEMMALQVSHAYVGLNDGVDRNVVEEATALPDPSPWLKLVAGAGLGLLLGLAALFVLDRKFRSPQVSVNTISTETPPAHLVSNRRVFAWLALACFIIGLLGCPFLIALHASEDAAATFGILGLLLAAILGMVSWSERLGRNVAMVVFGLLAASVATGVILGLHMRAREAKALEAVEAERQRIAAERHEAAAHAGQMASYLKMQQRLAQLETDEAKLEAQFTTNHPAVKSNLADIEAAKAQMKLLEQSEESKRLQDDPALAAEYQRVKKIYDDARGTLSNLLSKESQLESVYTTNSPLVKDNLRKIDAARADLRQIELNNPGLSLDDPADSSSHLLSNLPSGFHGYPVNRTLGELGDRFDLSTPETALASLLIRINGDATELVNKATIDFHPATKFTWKWDATNMDQTLRQFKIACVVIYHDDLACVITSTDSDWFGSGIAGLQDGQWKQLWSDAPDKTLTVNGAILQFEKVAPDFREKFQKFVNQPTATVAPTAENQLSNSVNQINHAIADTVLQMQRGAAQAGGNGGGSFTIGSPLGGPPLHYEWSPQGTNFIIKTNQ